MKYLVLISLGVTFLIAGCDLDIEETDSIFIEDSGDGGFSGVSDPAAAVGDLYNTLKGELSTHENLYALVEASTDETLVPTRGTDWGDNGIWRNFHTHNFDGSSQFMLNTWNQWNKLIFDATSVIETPSSGNSELADARFIRAWAMWVVMDNWGIVPFRGPADGADVFPSVLSRMEAFDLIMDDIDFAVENLPEEAVLGLTQNRANKSAARLMKAKFLLNKFIYDGSGSAAAADMATVIGLIDEIEGQGFALEDNFFGIFKSDPDTESIFVTDQNVGNRIWSSMHYNTRTPSGNATGWNGFSTLGEFYDSFEGPADNNRITDGSVLKDERRGYVPHPDDGNITAENNGFGFGFFVGQAYDGSGSALNDRAGNPLVFTREFNGLAGNGETNGIRILKYSPAPLEGYTGNTDADGGAYAGHSVELRFADAFLMRAEAKLRSGDNGGALADVNTLRALRDASALSSLDESTLLAERGRELYQEKWRRNDMIRFGEYTRDWEFKATDAVGNPDKNLMPIPNSALLSNPNLVQNPGY